MVKHRLLTCGRLLIGLYRIARLIELGRPAFSGSANHGIARDLKRTGDKIAGVTGRPISSQPFQFPSQETLPAETVFRKCERDTFNRFQKRPQNG
jgi:hypothetical protein